MDARKDSEIVLKLDGNGNVIGAESDSVEPCDGFVRVHVGNKVWIGRWASSPVRSDSDLCLGCAFSGCDGCVMGYKCKCGENPDGMPYAGVFRFLRRMEPVTYKGETLLATVDSFGMKPFADEMAELHMVRLTTQNYNGLGRFEQGRAMSTFSDAVDEWNRSNLF